MTSYIHILAEAFNDGRLLIGITQFDRTLDVGKDEGCLTDSMVIDLMHKIILDITGFSISKENVVPVSGKSALCSSQLKSLLVSESCGHIFDERLREVHDELKRYPKIDQDVPCGECEGTRFDLKEPTELTRMLDFACGIDTFSGRYIE